MLGRNLYPETVFAACVVDDCEVGGIVGGRQAAEALKKVHDTEVTYDADGNPLMHAVGYMIYYADTSINILRSS